MVTLSEDSCRVCLSCSEDTVYKSMYQIQHHAKDGPELYKELLGTNLLVEARGFPKRICRSCERIVIAFYDFRLQCTKNEKLLLSYLDCMNAFDGQCMVEAISEDDSGMDTLVDESPGQFEPPDDFDIFTTEEIDSVVDELIESSYQHAEKLVDLGTTIDEIVQECAENDLNPLLSMETKNSDPQLTELLCDLEENLGVPESVETQHEAEMEIVPVLIQASTVDQNEHESSSESVQSESSKQEPTTTTNPLQNDDEEVIVATIGNILQSCGKNFCCSICSNSYRTKYDLKRHCYRHFNIEIDKPACDFCTLRFDKHAQLRSHTETFHPYEDHRACDVCGRKFYNFLALRIHQYGAHKPKKKWQLKKKMCTHCGAIVPRLKEHILRVHDNHMFICGLCDGRQYKRREDLVVHMKTTHLKQKFRKCNHCTKTFASWISKYIHEIKVHTRNFPFICKLCDYKCCTKIRYEDHMRSHAGKKVYECPICLYGFATVSSLKKHFINHSVRSKLSCKQCGKYFQKKKHFTGHNEKHHKDPHLPLCQCPICPGKPIFSINDVNSHFSTKHPEFVMVSSSPPPSSNAI